MFTIGLLFDSQADVMSAIDASEATHYHWREPEEVEAVATHLTALGCSIDRIGSLDSLLERWQQNRLPNFVWNLSVGVLSRNRTALAPAILEQLSIPYTGADAAVKSLTLNKDWLKPVVQWAGIMTPAWLRYGLNEEIDSLPPWSSSILKPTCEGYSLGLAQFEAAQGLSVLQTIVQELHQRFHAPIVCEPLILGREITIGIVGNDRPVLLGAVETVTQEGEAIGSQVLDLTTKRRGGFKKVNVDLADPTLQPLKNAALTLMQFLKPLDYATFDFRIDTQNQAYLLDINADATLHPERSLSQVAKASGLTYGQLIELILKVSLKRWNLKKPEA